MQLTAKTSALILCLTLTGSLALADEVVITYRSGVVQQVPLQEPTEQIQQISYRKQASGQPPAVPDTTAPKAPQAAAPQQQRKASTTKTAPASVPEPKASTEKIPIKLKWAQPKDSW